METKGEHRICLKDLTRRRAYIDETFDFQKSIFFNTYEDIRRSVQKIVKDNRLLKHEIYGRKEPQEIGISNVISIIGRRGTGKSSVMLSYREALEGYGKSGDCLEDDSIRFSKEAKMGKVRFFALDYIDASVLEESEDVFILVLANMLNYLEKSRKRDNEKETIRDLTHHFEILYNDFLTVKENTQHKDDIYSSLETLYNIAGSQKVKMEFYNLVDEFLRYVRRKTGSDGDEFYLVISIDDLDMAHYNARNKPASCVNNKSYEIVNSIYKYLSVPGVIVLTAYNHVNLMQQNENFFTDSDMTNYHTEKNRGAQRKTSAKLSNQFMDKVFAPAYRTYMPSWKKSDYQKDRFRVDVLKGFDSDRNFFKKICKSEADSLSIKEMILFFYKEKIGVCYDCEGTKIHFLEPDSLRRLTDEVLLFETEKFSLTEQVTGEAQKECRRIIFKKVKDDLYFHFVQEKLFLPEEKEFYDDLMELRIDRRSERIVREISKISSPLGKSARKREKNYRALLEKAAYDMGNTAENIAYAQDILSRVNDNSNVSYSLAEFVHSIYHMSREIAGYTREFATCILHSYSIYLSELYDEYCDLKKEIPSDVFIRYFRENSSDEKYAEKLGRIAKLHELFIGIIGDSVCGRWCEYYFPEVYTHIIGSAKVENSEKVILGYCSLPALSFAFSTSNNQPEIKRFVKEIVFMSMFCVDLLDWRSDNLRPIQKGDQFEITLEGTQDVEMTAFVKYSFMYPEFLKKMKEILKTVQKEIVKSPNGRGKAEQAAISAALESAIKNVLDELWKKFRKWDQAYGNMALPVHNFDCFYNLIKHLFQENAKSDKTECIADGKDFFRQMEQMKQMFLGHLKKIDDFYKNEGTKSFAAVFSRCPFWGLADELGKNEKTSKEVGKNVTSIIMHLSSKKRAAGGADSWQEGNFNV